MLNFKTIATSIQPSKNLSIKIPENIKFIYFLVIYDSGEKVDAKILRRSDVDNRIITFSYFYSTSYNFAEIIVLKNGMITEFNAAMNGNEISQGAELYVLYSE